MLNCRLTSKQGKALTVLCLGAHSDDIEIGCGGTILKLIEDYERIEFYWVVFSSGKERRREAKASASAFLERAKRKTVIIKNFRDGFFPYSGREIKTYFERLKRNVAPDVIFTHYRSDLHQDHRVISDLAWNTFRDHLILEYEIPKYDGDFGCPNFFVHLTESICNRKINISSSILRVSAAISGSIERRFSLFFGCEESNQTLLGNTPKPFTVEARGFVIIISSIFEEFAGCLSSTE